MAAQRADLTTTEEYTLRILEAHVAAPSSTTLQTTINSLANPIESAYTSGEHGKADGLLWSLWTTLLRYARSLSWDQSSAAQESLVNLLKELKKRPDPAKPTNFTAEEDLLAQWSFSSIWASLCVFGAACREELDECPGSRPADLPISAQANDYVNVIAFMARVAAAGVMDFSLFGFWALRDTLEAPDPAFPTTLNHSHELDAYLPAVAMWVIILGAQMHERIGMSSDETGSSWETEATKERWEGWIKALREMEARLDLLPETKSLATKAADAMEAVM